LWVRVRILAFFFVGFGGRVSRVILLKASCALQIVTYFSGPPPPGQQAKQTVSWQPGSGPLNWGQFARSLMHITTAAWPAGKPVSWQPGSGPLNWGHFARSLMRIANCANGPPPPGQQASQSAGSPAAFHQIGVILQDASCALQIVTYFVGPPTPATCLFPVLFCSI